MKDYYAILKVPVNAEPERIRKQYRLLVVAFHPDKFTERSEKAEAEEQIKEINEAYEVLVDPAKRAKYDRSRKSHSGIWHLVVDSGGYPGRPRAAARIRRYW